MDATRGATVGSAGAQPAPAPAPARPSTCPPTWSGVRCGDRRRVDYPFNCIGAACVERGGASGCTWHDVGTLAQPYVDAQCRTPRQQWQHMYMCIACDDKPINAWQQQAEAERAAVAAALRLERDYLCVQGPPGTGKTFVGSRAAAALIAAGRRVGVLAHSHAAVHNMVEKTIGALSRAGARGRLVKIGGDKEEAARLQRGCGEGLRVERVASASALKGEPLKDVLLVGGTAWAFSSEALAGQVDVLLVDEAGQLPLANLVGASRAADSLVLLGDQMQLPAPCEGTHPAESGRSGLEHLLRGEPTVPPSLGVSLSESHRLHPALCSLVSELVYSGHLSSHASAARRSLALGQRPPAAGCPPGCAAPPASSASTSSTAETASRPRRRRAWWRSCATSSLPPLPVPPPPLPTPPPPLPPPPLPPPPLWLPHPTLPSPPHQLTCAAGSPARPPSLAALALCKV